MTAGGAGKMDTDILIIGGGLAGLRLAHLLDLRGHDYQLVEARNRLGGRILTTQVNGGAFDLGPAWFWPGQPRIAALIRSLGLTPFEQHADGHLIFEDEAGQTHRGQGFASADRALRLQGGFGALIAALAGQVTAQRLHVGAPVTRLVRSADRITAHLPNGTIVARHVVLALPPRIAADRMMFSPAMPDATIAAMARIPTWMAGHAKAVAVYDHPFWRDAGLSGDAISRRGPLAEIHDASAAPHGPFALFGFVGVPAAARANEDALRAAIRAQLLRLFGAAAGPAALHIKDWARDPHTAIDADAALPAAHPQYGLPAALQGLWDGRVQFAGTEVASRFGGYVEGALEAAEAVAVALAAVENPA